MINRRKNHLLGWQALRLLSFLPLWNIINGQIRYTIPEEMTEGSVVGNLAKDLALGVAEIAERKLRIASEPGKQYFSVDLERAELAVSGTIDRESLCGQSAGCVLPVQLVIENPLQLYRVEVEIQDINDNSPVFLTKEHILEIAESVTPGTRFPLESAEDADVGSNSLRSYVINTNECFSLNIKSLENGRKTPELILDKTLDREKQSVHKLVLTAVDGGNPAKSGTTLINVVVQDTNDNAPKFDRTLYKTSISENVGNGTTVLALKATDLDEGPNAEIQYYFGSHTPDIILKTFRVNPNTGDIIVIGQLDFEEMKSYTFDVRAKDRGNPSLEGHSSVQVDILDENDNSPEVILTSLPNPVQENAPVGTVIALINVKDLDSGENGKVELNIPPNSPFKLKSSFENHYSLVTDSRLDREISPEYNIVIIASDLGSPRLQMKKIVNVKVLDVNDNPPVFSQPSYNVYVTENNLVGLSLYSVSASDIDADVNSLLSYSILDSTLESIPVSSYFYINSENGTIYSLNSFDYERNKVFHVVVQAKDQGSPSLSSNATVHVFIQDQNDNAPVVIYPSVIMGSTSHQKLPRSAKAGHLVTKVTAVDADSGHNAWISYKLVEATDASLFSVNLYTGEVRTKRAVSDQDDSSHRLLIEIKDNGEPMQSTTVTVGISLEDGFQEPILDLQHEQHEPTNKDGKITFYLIIALASISAVSLLTFVILTVKCVRYGRRRTCCCMRQGDPDDHKNRNLHIQLNTDGPIKYVEVLGGDMLSQSQSFRSCLSPMSEFSDLTLIKPSSTMDFKEMVNVIDASLPDSAWTFESQQVSQGVHTNYLQHNVTSP